MPYVEYDEVEAICPDCGRIFRSEEALAAHREESHAGLEEAARPSLTARNACPVCGREYATASALRAHASEAHRRGPGTAGR